MIAHYLNTLGIDTTIKDLALVQALQEKHLETFIFSSLNVLLQEPLSLELDTIHERLVQNRRGGYCFEHNKLFFEALKYLGFEVRPILGRVLNNREVQVPRTHRITLLDFEGKSYLVDVGFGAYCSHQPLDLNEAITLSSRGHTYRITKKDHTYYLAQKHKEDFFTYYSFECDEAFEADFEMGHFYSHKHPHATFVNHLVASFITPETTYSLRNGTFQTMHSRETTTERIVTASQLQKILNEVFSYALCTEDADKLYARLCKADQ